MTHSIVVRNPNTLMALDTADDFAGALGRPKGIVLLGPVRGAVSMMAAHLCPLDVTVDLLDSQTGSRLVSYHDQRPTALAGRRFGRNRLEDVFVLAAALPTHLTEAQFEALAEGEAAGQPVLVYVGKRSGNMSPDTRIAWADFAERREFFRVSDLHALSAYVQAFNLESAS